MYLPQLETICENTYQQAGKLVLYQIIIYTLTTHIYLALLISFNGYRCHHFICNDFLCCFQIQMMMIRRRDLSQGFLVIVSADLYVGYSCTPKGALICRKGLIISSFIKFCLSLHRSWLILPCILFLFSFWMESHVIRCISDR